MSYLGNVMDSLKGVSNTGINTPDANYFDNAGFDQLSAESIPIGVDDFSSLGGFGQDSAQGGGLGGIGGLFNSDSLGGIGSLLGGVGSIMGYMNAKEQNEMMGDELQRKAALDRTNLANQAKAANENLSYKSGRRATNAGLSGAERDAQIAGTMDKYGLSGVAA